MLPKVSFIHWTDRAFFYGANGNIDSIKKIAGKRALIFYFSTHSTAGNSLMPITVINFLYILKVICCNCNI